MQAKEQDDAAGGRHNRGIHTAPDALGRVVLRRQYRRLYAELRWIDATKMHAEYLGEMTWHSRADNFAAAWRLAHARGLTARALEEESAETGCS